MVTCWLPLGGDRMERRGRRDGDAWDICPWLSGMFSHRGPAPGPQPRKPGRGGTCQLVTPVCQTASPSLIGLAYVWPQKWVWLLEINKDQVYEQSMQLKGFPPHHHQNTYSIEEKWNVQLWHSFNNLIKYPLQNFDYFSVETTFVFTEFNHFKNINLLAIMIVFTNREAHIYCFKDYFQSEQHSLQF